MNLSRPATKMLENPVKTRILDWSVIRFRKIPEIKEPDLTAHSTCSFLVHVSLLVQP